ncbi:hypothetical protein M9458_040246, partial [Cirrhinus mrigala]
NLLYNINHTTVSLEWTPPADTGGRNDVTPKSAFLAGAIGLTDTYVTITDLLAHANYTFEVEAVNGVSDLSRTQRLFAAVSIATSQA